ncbi:MAG: hypothetical protein M1837_003302 [Sclerophora amabilis]|nr:MAG: hypothetical protein M1837_003302 [Sclerophora amabilis]
MEPLGPSTDSCFNGNMSLCDSGERQTRSSSDQTNVDSWQSSDCWDNTPESSAMNPDWAVEPSSKMNLGHPDSTNFFSSYVKIDLDPDDDSQSCRQNIASGPTELDLTDFNSANDQCMTGGESILSEINPNMRFNSGVPDSAAKQYSAGGAPLKFAVKPPMWSQQSLRFKSEANEIKRTDRIEPPETPEDRNFAESRWHDDPWNQPHLPTVVSSISPSSLEISRVDSDQTFYGLDGMSQSAGSIASGSAGSPRLLTDTESSFGSASPQSDIVFHEQVNRNNAYQDSPSSEIPEEPVTLEINDSLDSGSPSQGILGGTDEPSVAEYGNPGPLCDPSLQSGGQYDVMAAVDHSNRRRREADFLQQARPRDVFLVQAKRAGLSYKEIREMGNFIEAESTLRGRYRNLTKQKQHRLRKPEWKKKDERLLLQAIKKFTGYQDEWTEFEDPTGTSAAIEAEKVPWKKVANYIVRQGGSYHFGNATCRKKFDEIRSRTHPHRM